jgi:predicted helicase
VANGMPNNFTFDLAIFDEAHKTAGRENSRFAFALADKNLRIKNRIFMTATPRHYDVRRKDKEGDSKVVYSMDVPEVYGETIYTLSFREAIERELICDYKVLMIGT